MKIKKVPRPFARFGAKRMEGTERDYINAQFRDGVKEIVANLLLVNSRAGAVPIT